MTLFVQSRVSQKPLTYQEALLLVYSNLLLRKHHGDRNVVFLTTLQGHDEMHDLLPCSPQLDTLNFNSRVWAMGKLAALLLAYRHNEHAIHVDSDVFLHKPLPREFQTAPVVAQSPDSPVNYASEDMRRALGYIGLTLNPAVVAYNAGIIGGLRRLMAAWCATGLDLSSRIPDTVNPTAASMAIEQYRLGLDLGRMVRPLFVSSRPDPSQVSALGYAHWTGDEKWKPERIAQVERKMQADFPRAMRKLESKGLPHASRK